MPNDTRLYALLVGINEYAAPSVPTLRGCVNDIRHARTYLEHHTADGTELRLLVLLDAAATRDAIIEAVRSHLGSAGAADTVLFWFSGHGSEAHVPDSAWFTEPTGLLQTLVCADSRTHGVPDLWDKELSVLLDHVAARAGHVAVVLDSCHSDGATRDVTAPEPGMLTRAVAEAPPRTRDSLIPELTVRAAAPHVPDHVALAAARSFEPAQEARLDRQWRGLFSWALLRALHRRGAAAGYRDLIAAAQTDVERRSGRQVPQLRPLASPLADHAFLNSTLARPGAPMRMRWVRDSWEIDAGAVHGLPVGDGVRVGVRDSSPAREAEVIEVHPERSLVVPLHGWSPSVDDQFPVVLTAVPLPPVAVAVTGDPAGVASLLTAVRTAGPGRQSSLHVRALADSDTGAHQGLHAMVDRDGAMTLTDRDGEQMGRRIPDVRGAGARRAVAVLEHIACWQHVLDLENDVSRLAGAVRIEIVDAEPGDIRAPAMRPGRRPDRDGRHHLRYRRTAGGWEPPEIFVRLHNTSDRRLYCVLLDLNSRFRVDHSLFPGDFIGPGRHGAAVSGRRIRAALPDGMRPEPGIRVRDRLKLIVAERQFSAQPFRLPALGAGPERAAFDAPDLAERLGAVAAFRDLVDAGAGDGTYDWTTDTVSLVTEVPLSRHPH
ncbi:caspase family protein [Actinoplanes auranticolor]|uniref:caspase family protein n=1 Tax=Actinoplanes auranticolor TaxID=47988 RepID=UPI001BB39955|nr:caspase family protein [Actinoplanes auranticolor]